MTREPLFKAPGPALAVVAVIIGGFVLQGLAGSEAVFQRLGYAPAAGLAHGGWITLFTAIFLHASWTHALMNAAFGLAFAAPVARYYGDSPRGLLAFAGFYLLTGAFGNLGFGWLHPAETGPLIGASGAVSGLAAAAARLVAGQGRVGALRSPVVVGMAAGWLITNLLIAVLGFAPGAGGGQVAWEAHLFGFAAGLILVEPLAWLARPRISD